MHLAQYWPHLRILRLTRNACEDISLDIFMRLLISCRHLEQVTCRVVCSSLPDETIVSEVAWLQYAFRGPLDIVAIDDEDQLARVFCKTLPHVI